MFMIDHLPLDVLYEISLWLPASAILCLSRTKRSIRKALLSRSAQHVWRSAMDELAPPECPDDLAVPAYLSLMVERICSYCGMSDCQQLFFALRRRCCKECFGKKDNFLSAQDMMKELGHDIYHHLAVPSLILVSPPRTWVRTYPGLYRPMSQALRLRTVLQSQYPEPARRALSGDRWGLEAARNTLQDIVPEDLLTATSNFKRAELSASAYENWISIHVKLEKMQEYRASRVARSKA